MKLKIDTKRKHGISSCNIGNALNKLVNLYVDYVDNKITATRTIYNFNILSTYMMMLVMKNLLISISTT